MRRTTLLGILLLAGVLMIQAKVKLPSLICDNMVLQQQTDVTLWGSARPGAKVRVTPSWDGKVYTAQADKQGNWKLRVATPAAGYTPYDIRFDDGEAVTVSNVLVGEVWLASGQSNMEMPLKGFGGCCVEGGMAEAIASSQVKGVRMFTVPKRQSYEPLYDCEGTWKMPDVYNTPDFSATAWFFARNVSEALGIPVGIVNCSYGGTKVESWLSREVLEGYPDVTLEPDSLERMTEYHRPLLMYNGMLKAVQNYTIKGIIWYQGCSNVGAHDTYAERLATMVSLWRKEWGLGELPFYFVEIAPYDYGSGDYASGARLREAQLKAESLIPNSAMTSTNDLVEPYERYNIHPRNKRTVGLRLSFLALNLTYGMQHICCFGPRYKSMEVKGSEAWISFTHLGMGICRNYDLKGFEVAGEDRVFHPADNVWLHWQTNEVVISSQAVEKPVAVRYCFRDFQSGTMIGGNELPTVPFRTDDW